MNQSDKEDSRFEVSSAMNDSDRQLYFADFVIVEENPLQNLKVLYGTGAIKLTEDNEVVRVGGVKYTIKDGIIYDAKQLLRDVKAMVDAAKKKEGFTIKQPGIKD